MNYISNILPMPIILFYKGNFDTETNSEPSDSA